RFAPEFQFLQRLRSIEARAGIPNRVLALGGGGSQALAPRYDGRGQIARASPHVSKLDECLAARLRRRIGRCADCLKGAGRLREERGIVDGKSQEGFSTREQGGDPRELGRSLVPGQ